MGLNGVVSGYPTSTNFPQVDGGQRDPREWGVTSSIKFDILAISFVA